MHMHEWTLPVQAEFEGRVYRIRTDYREILTLIRWLDERNTPGLCPEQRWNLAMVLFYPDFDAMPPQDYARATDFLQNFLAGGRPEPAVQAPPLFSWQQDAVLIAAGISRAVGCDVRTLPYLHWWSFLACFDSIGDGAFATVVAIRDKLRRAKPLEPWEMDYYRTHRAQVELRRPARDDEAARCEKQRLLAMLG